MKEPMARLNDPPAPPPESIDALKRRFIRQNREFARVNSNQSQRIRNLETEISRLLAENITLREQAISSAADAERWRTSNGLGKDVLEMKGRLAAKLAEIHEMVDELGGLPQKAAARRSSVRSRRSASKQDLVRSPNERDWRNRQTLGGVLNAERELQEGKLPAILEDKYYPRRTLEPAEIGQLIDEVDGKKDDTESPELGPPPVAHFDISEPIVFDSSKMPKRVSGGIIPDDEETLTLPTNLETRRKRRTSSLLQDMTVLPEESNEIDKGNSSSSLLKTGAKRKLDVSQLEETVPMVPADDFVFQRKGTVSIKPKPSRFTGSQSRQQDQPTLEQLSPRKALEPTRQVLSSKSTNSPAKRRVANSFDKKDIDKDNTTARGRSGHMSTIGRTQPLPQVDVLKDTDRDLQFVSQQPKTPGLILTEILSPSTIPTEPSSKPAAMTRSEIATTHSVEDVLNGSIGRGSRRARAAVSYAEPNLRDKMRRPDKKLVGAVEGLKRESLRDIGADVPDVEAEDIAYVKREPSISENDNQNWKQLPVAGHSASNKEEAVSPLRDKESKQVALRMAERRHKRTFSEVDAPLVKTESSRVQDQLDKATARLSIYDPPTSSPPIRDSKETETETFGRSDPDKAIPASLDGTGPVTSIAVGPTARVRRHSVQMQSSSIPNPASKGNTGTVRPPPRPNSALSTREINASGRDASSMKLKKTSSAHTLLQSQSQARSHSRVPLNSGSAHEEDNGNGARTMGTRRRSMMI